MKNLKLYLYMFTTASLLTAASCSSGTDSEKKDVSQMDSVSNDLDKSNDSLIAETKKVEASLEKIDKELTPAK